MDGFAKELTKKSPSKEDILIFLMDKSERNDRLKYLLDVVEEIADKINNLAVEKYEENNKTQVYLLNLVEKIRDLQKDMKFFM